MVRIIRYAVSLIVLVISMVLLVWAVWPEQRQSVQRFLLPEEMRLPTNGQAASPALLGVRQVSLEWPESMRIGDISEIKLVFEPANTEILAPKPPNEYIDAYKNFNLMVEGRFEVAGMKVEPANPTRESLPSRQVVKYTWQVSAQEKGRFTGTVWLFLRFLPLDGSEASQVPILISPLDIQAISFLGLSGGMGRVLGGAGIVVGIALNYDILFRWVKKSHKGLNGHKGKVHK